MFGFPFARRALTALVVAGALVRFGGGAAQGAALAGAGAARTTAATAPSPADGVPAQNLPGWNLVLAEDFTRPASLGHFASVYPGWAGYDGWHDTTGHGLYDSATTTSVHDGVVDQFLHSDGKTAQVTALTPRSPHGSRLEQTYGRYAVRFRADNLPGYKLAALLWPSSGDWNQGEIDFPEANLDRDIRGYSHDVTGQPVRNAFVVKTGALPTDWHTAVTEWTPDHITFTLDGMSWSTTDGHALPTQRMVWVLHTETQTYPVPVVPDAKVSGHVLIDWVAAWSRA
jgi:hypothetical protein